MRDTWEVGEDKRQVKRTDHKKTDIRKTKRHKKIEREKERVTQVCKFIDMELLQFAV